MQQAGLASSESVVTLAAATTGLVSGLGLEVLTQEAPDFKGAFEGGQNDGWLGS